MTVQPSPASSPSPTDSSQPSRKRQRSQSMQSDASSSSLKRTVVDGSASDGVLRSPRSNQMSTLTLADPNHDIDAYMAEQGENEMPELIPTGTSFLGQSPPLPLSASASEKLLYVDKAKNRRMEVAETWYLVSREWWKRWRKALSGEADKDGPVNEQDLGPVDNSRLLDSYGNLGPVVEGIDVEFVPAEVWKCFSFWYGETIHPLPRRVIERGTSKQVSLELRPPRLKVLRLAIVQTEGSRIRHITISAGETIETFNAQLAAAVTPSEQKNTPYRVWKIDPVEDDSPLELLVPSLASLGAKLLEDSEKILEEEGIQSDDCFVVEIKDPSGWIASTSLPVPPPPLTVAGRPGVLAPLFNSKDGFFDRMSRATTASTSVTKVDGAYDSPLSLSWKGSRTMEKALEPGTLGLGNMGNTCFMNSALQCLAHNKELTDYFLTGLYQEELNPDNPLGMHGAIAEAFGALLQRIWAKTGTSTSYSPREFKLQLQRFAPQFSGYQQHDSQELVAFLLDGLHEDLNRVLKKPYVEKPDWEGGDDLDLVKLAQTSWEGYMKRNDSVIVDLFQGQYQSTLVCPECEKISITFDPFMYLTLPIPIHKKWKHSIYYVPWDLRKPHLKIPVEISGEASFRDLRALLGRWMNANPLNLLTLEIFNNRFYKNLNDHVQCGDTADNDIIVCFELPCHAQQSRGYKRQPGDPFIVPVYLCDLSPPTRPSYLQNRGTAHFGYPTVVPIMPEEANDLDTIYDMVLMRLQRWSNNSRDLFNWEPSSALPVDEVHITANGFPTQSVTEIRENGDVVAITESDPIDGDIVDEKSMTIDEGDELNISASQHFVPRRVGTKKNVFNLRLQSNHKDFGTQLNHYGSNRWDSWDTRTEQADTHPGLLRQDDALYCEFDENMKAYYFGDDRSRWEHALWDKWEEFHHPEYLESRKSTSDKKNKGLSLQDCLDEFTKEEKLGEDDLWYCPRCKKHQQATKKFDLWKAPDVLVVHLKRFSNNRMLRDKIDAFIDFPVEGLDLTTMVGERAVAQRLVQQGHDDLQELGIGDVVEPLVYDLFGVDEHIGGLGGGHYRAYVLNHLNDKWYHFDDSFVTPARASDAVNANAYLLFYRRRTTNPLGGKTHHKIEEARLKPSVAAEADSGITLDTQLPTPPNEERDYNLHLPQMQGLSPASWAIRSRESTVGSSAASPSSDELPVFEDSQLADNLMAGLDPLLLATQRFDFPDPSGKVSPTSSNEVEVDSDIDLDLDEGESAVEVNEVVPGSSTDGQSGRGSPSSASSFSDPNPFNETTAHEKDDVGRL